MKRNWTLLKILLRIFREDFLLNEDNYNLHSELTAHEWIELENNDKPFPLGLLVSVFEHSDYSIFQLLTDARNFTRSIKSSHSELYESILSDNLSSGEVTSIYWLLKNRNDFIITRSRPRSPKEPRYDRSYYFIETEYGEKPWKYKD